MQMKTTIFFVFLLSAVQAVLLQGIRNRDVPDHAPEIALANEATSSYSALVDLIADGRSGLHGSYSYVSSENAPELEPFQETVVGETRVYSQDQYYEELVNKYAEYYQVDPLLVTLIIEQESGFDANALSPTGAMGLMQLMPDTAWMLGVEDPWNPEENIAGGVRYFSQQLDNFQSIELALAAYNAGPNSVISWGGIPPYPETTDYVENIMAKFSKAQEAAREAAAPEWTKD